MLYPAELRARLFLRSKLSTVPITRVGWPELPREHAAGSDIGCLAPAARDLTMPRGPCRAGAGRPYAFGPSGLTLSESPCASLFRQRRPAITPSCRKTGEGS